MLKNKTINMGVIKKVAAVLGELNDQVAYVGGATVSIYADDPTADDVRPTKDIDIMLNIVSFAELAALQENLGKKGIFPDPDADINCRFKYDDVIIDVMATKEVGWAPSDPWFEPGFNNLVTFEIDAGTTIRILSAPYFLAAKFSAFHDRGKDPRTSKDFEDIVYVLDNSLSIVDSIRASPADVSQYLKSELHKFLDGEMNESISAHLSPFSQEGRLGLLRDKIKAILA
jgi:predicted nucleotidyltransferase